MIKMRAVSPLLLLIILPMGCGDTDGLPSAPSAPSVSDAGNTANNPPAAVKKGRKTVRPGGASGTEP